MADGVIGHVDDRSFYGVGRSQKPDWKEGEQEVKKVEMSLLWNFAPMGSRRMGLDVHKKRCRVKRKWFKKYFCNEKF